MKKAYEFHNAGKMPDLDPPVWLDKDIFLFWKDNYGLTLT